jgi:hypothetical protein
LAAKGQNPDIRPGMKKPDIWPASHRKILLALLAEMPPAILAAEPGAGDADKAVAVGIGIAADRSGRDASHRAGRAADDAGRDIARPEAAVVVPAVVAVPPGAIPVDLVSRRNRMFRFEGCAIVKPM